MHTDTSLYDVYLDAALAGEPEEPTAFLSRRGVDDASLLRSLRALRSMVEAGRVERDAPPTERLGEFRLLRPLGGGGMGRVFLAEQPSLQRCVALKLIRPERSQHPEALERFRREAHALAQLRHPHIVPVFGFGEGDAGSLYLAMELIPGQSLADKLAQAGAAAFEQRAVLGWLRDIARALQAVHQAGIVHRDVKPANICIRPDGHALLIDFGLVRQDGHATITRTFVGTPAYASPEQVRGTRSLDARSDIYSLGVTLYQCLTGLLPFGDRPLAKVVERILTEEPTPPRVLEPELSEDLERIVQRAMARDPAARYPDAESLANALDTLLAPAAVALAPRPRPAGYKLLELLGRGAQGSVYRARHTTTGKTVALKIIDPWRAEMVERFLREAQLASGVRHPNLVRVLAAGRRAGRCFLAMELVEGRNLQEQVENDGPLSLGDAVRCALHVGRGLLAAHGHGVLHRDVKPANIFWGKDGRVLLGDFGLARGADSQTLTATGALLGTPATMAPEVCAGEPASQASDQYSLAITLFFLLTGHFPFEGRSALATLQAHIHDAAPDVRTLRPDCPAHIAQALGKALAKPPARRFADVADFSRALEAPVHRPLRPLLAWGGVALLLLLVLPAAWWALSTQPQGLDAPRIGPAETTSAAADQGAQPEIGNEPAPSALSSQAAAEKLTRLFPHVSIKPASAPGSVRLHYEFDDPAQLEDFEGSPGLKAIFKPGQGVRCQTEPQGFWVHRGRFRAMRLYLTVTMPDPTGHVILVYVSERWEGRLQAEYSFWDGQGGACLYLKSARDGVSKLAEGDLGYRPAEQFDIFLERGAEDQVALGIQGQWPVEGQSDAYASGQPGLMLIEWTALQVRRLVIEGVPDPAWLAEQE